jgi:hypothetical protein
MGDLQHHSVTVRRLVEAVRAEGLKRGANLQPLVSWQLLNPGSHQTVRQARREDAKTETAANPARQGRVARVKSARAGSSRPPWNLSGRRR